MRHKYTQKGFTLLELLIVLAVIGVIAAIELPLYFEYQAKAKSTAGLAEISAGKSSFESLVNNGFEVTAASDIGLAALTGTCAITASSSATPAGIHCTIKNASDKIQGKTISLTRSDAGVWQCVTDIPTVYAPKLCEQSP